MAGLGELQREYGVPAQSICPKTCPRSRGSKELCPGTDFYGQAYSRFGLFGGPAPP